MRSVYQVLIKLTSDPKLNIFIVEKEGWSGPRNVLFKF